MQLRLGRSRADADVRVDSAAVGARYAPKHERIALRYQRSKADGGGICKIIRTYVRAAADHDIVTAGSIGISCKGADEGIARAGGVL